MVLIREIEGMILLRSAVKAGWSKVTYTTTDDNPVIRGIRNNRTWNTKEGKEACSRRTGHTSVVMRSESHPNLRKEEQQFCYVARKGLYFLVKRESVL